jgi:site-specific DNA-methyltransferase (adenine-specific)
MGNGASLLKKDEGNATKVRAGRNRTLTATSAEVDHYRARLLSPATLNSQAFLNRTIHGDCFEAMKKLPKASVDLLVLDPPYNLNKKFGATSFARVSVDAYTDYLRTIFRAAKPLLKPTATVSVCGDWLSSTSIFLAASEFFTVRNRITWEREKGRGALTNWKNSSEDIWFCTLSDEYTFNVEAVKLRRKVIAPYRSGDGSPKDWQETSGGNFRDTHPSNLWNDITIPFWSMPENTDHPTQKSEKLIAKLILASTRPGDVVLDPFLGSGTTSVVASKLGRKFCGIELDEEFAVLAEKRLALAEHDKSIQGYADRVFWERNTLNLQNGAAGNSLKAVPPKRGLKAGVKKADRLDALPSLFDE